MQNMKRSEVLDSLKRDYPEYAWSLPTLDRRMRHFDIKYINYETTVDEVVAAFNTENDGPGQLLGYRAMHKKLREQHGLAVPCGLVYDVMTMECPEGLKRRKKKRKRGPVGTFTSLVSMGKKKITFQQIIHLVIFLFTTLVIIGSLLSYLLHLLFVYYICLTNQFTKLKM